MFVSYETEVEETLFVPFNIENNARAINANAIQELLQRPYRESNYETSKFRDEQLALVA